ncbi:hypothetical protein PHYPSEUDO_009883 [Phytophthora pseudosyringae]|uniref:Uncharacterized protein n=1 Tax=Phytophthora pseudosyringae TaxID=221518 RepID=A0A8T1VEC0_9STRA|nr:hypothetical protein PHYPSEUDO_009883 [Phytophthora pseudosyringae]
MQASDFQPAARAPWGTGVGVGGALLATLGLGFTEGCLEVERRPIPLRFALRFAAANVLPSAVWGSVPARHVAAASGVPLTALISDAGVAGSRSVAVGRRLVLVKSVRALRLATGSYGLAWGLWRWHEADVASHGRNNDTQHGVKCGESVVRLAPVNSPLSRASKRKHGHHIVTVPVETESWKEQDMVSAVDAVDWEKVGIQVQSGEEEGVQGERVQVIEVELSDVETTAAYAGKMKAKASSGEGMSVCSVAVLPLSGPPLPTSIADSFDVCFNPLSAVLAFIALACRERGVGHVALVAEEEDEGVEADVNPNGPRLQLSTAQLVTGLLYRHGITASVSNALDKEPVVKQVEGELTADHPADNSRIVFFLSESLSAGRLAARNMDEQGLMALQDACFIVEESLTGQSVPSEQLEAQSALLKVAVSSGTEEQNASEQQEKAEVDEQEPVATYLSIADVSDQTLQGIRKLVRQGKKPDAIQAAVYQAYGVQLAVAPTRLDQFSDMHI